MLKLYGKNCFKYIWEPIIKGKFGEKSHMIPLRWMSGRLKQRLESRVNGKESLGLYLVQYSYLQIKLKNI